MGSTRSGVGGKEHTHGAIGFPPGVNTTIIAPPGYDGRIRYSPENPTVVNVGTGRTVTTDTTALLSEDTLLVDATSGNVTITLPSAEDQQWKRYYIRRVDQTGSTVKVVPDGSELIDLAIEIILPSFNNGITITSDDQSPGGWWRI